MSRCVRRKSGWTRAGIAFAMVASLAILASGCAKTTVGGDAGCQSYAEARLAMPRDVALPSGAWGGWIADLDDRMTGACR